MKFKSMYSLILILTYNVNLIIALYGGCIFLDINSTDSNEVHFFENTCNVHPKCTNETTITTDGWKRVQNLKYMCDKNPPETILVSFDLKLFPNLREVDVSSLQTPQIKITLDSGDRIGAEKLNASHNRLDSSPSRPIYDLMPNLREIDFSSNQIKVLASTTFHGASMLMKMNYSHNSISQVQNGTFSAITFLEVIDLSSNLISVLLSGTFRTNQAMKYLNLQNNSLTRFDFHIFSPSVTSIEVLLPTSGIQYMDVSCKDSACLFKGFNGAETMEDVQKFNASGNHFENIVDVLSRLG